MSRLHRVKRGLLSQWQYYEKVLRVESSARILYHPLWEQTGTVATDISGANRHGTLVNITLNTAGIPDGRTCASFDGATSYVNAHSASFAAAFSGVAGSIVAWWRVANAGVWTDATVRQACAFRVDANNLITMRNSAVNNVFEFQYKAGGIAELIAAAYSDTDWICLGLSWDKNAGATGEVKAYKDGVQEGATQDNLGVWAGALDNTRCCWGAATTTPSSEHHGFMAHCMMWTRALTAAQFAWLAAV